MIRLLLNTKKFTDVQTIGLLEVWKNNVFQFCLSTLEQEWNNNKTSDSCVFPGLYIIEPHSSTTHGDCFILRDVKGRTAILIHSGNYCTHTEGCILVGLTHGDINNDGYLDVISSKEAMKKLLSVCQNEKVIYIDIKR